MLAILLLPVFMGLTTSSERTRDVKQLSYPQRSDVTLEGENLWDRIDVQKLERQLDSWHSGQSSPVPSPSPSYPANAISSEARYSPARQFYPGVPDPSGEVPRPIPPNPITLPTVPPVVLPEGCLASRGQFPSPRSCANYLNCWDDVVIEQPCPTGLLFNDLLGVCDFEYNVNCGNRPGATPKPPLQPGSRLCPDPNGRYRSATNCSEFYVCLVGRPIKFNCPRGLVYNAELGVCDYTYRVDCQGSATPGPLLPPAPPATVAPPVKPLPPSPSYPVAPEQPNLPPLQPTNPVAPEQPQYPPQPQPTWPSGSYPANPWFGKVADPWTQHPAASQVELENAPQSEASPRLPEAPQQQQQEHSTAPPAHQNPWGLQQQQEHSTAPPALQNPWGLLQSVPAELAKVPCETGNVHRLTDSCSSVIVCRHRRPQLVQCPTGQTYDRPSDSCRHFTIAKWYECYAENR